MNNLNLEKEIRQNTLQKIKEGNVHMRPKFYFVIRIVLAIIAAFLSLILSVFIISFILFSIQKSGQQFLLSFGVNSIFTFFLLFPWFLFILDIALIFLFEWLIRGFKSVYRISLLTIFSVIFTTSIILGILLNLTPIHGVFLNKADHGELPFIGEIYERIHDSHTNKGVFKGIILSMDQNKIIIGHNDGDLDTDDGSRLIILPENHPELQIGERVYVFGSVLGDNSIQAQGIRSLLR